MSRRAFTLVEVLIAIALVAMLSGSVFAFLWTLIGRRDLMQDRSLQAAAGTAFIGRLESDITCCLAGDDAAGAGISGTSSRIKLLTRGVWLPDGSAERAATAGDLQASEYVFDAATGTLKGRRWAVLGTNAAPDAAGFETISSRVQRLRLRYSDGTTWHDSFDSGTAGTLPIAIEVAIWFGDPLPPSDSGSSSAAPDSKGAPAPATPDKTDSGKDQGSLPGDAQKDSSSGSPQNAPGSSPAPLPAREPDRLRVIVIPDGPVTSWKESR